MALKTENIPAPLRDTRRWVVFKVYAGKKVPVTPDGREAKSNDPTTWSVLPNVLKAIEFGIGNYPALALGPDYPLRFYDLDDCIGAEGHTSKLATDILAAAPDTYVERSVSGTGIHLLAWIGDAVIANGRFCDGLEVYGQSPRFCIFTGDLLDGSSSTVNEEPVDLVNLLASLGSTGPMSHHTASSGLRSGGKCGVVSAGAFRIPTVITEGARNSELARIARYFHNRNLNGELLPLMHLINTNRCKPPLKQQEIDAIVRSAQAVKRHIIITPNRHGCTDVLELCAKAEKLGMEHLDPAWIIDNISTARTRCRDYITGVRL
jgi:hypothetical protein